MTRIFLFLATNIAVIAVLSVVLAVLGIDSRSMGGSLVVASVVGFGGALISLMLSKWVAIRSTGAQVIKEPKNETERWLLETVQRQAQAAGIGMPDVAIYGGPEMNAFATGASKNNALVAVSAGLLQGMNRDEVEAVLAHEVSHVANGDMVTMALLQGVVNTFVIFLARVVAQRIANNQLMYFAIYMGLQVLFGMLASVITMWFSRRREFRADAGAAQLADKNKMIAALERLGQNSGESTLPEAVQAFGISGKGASKLFMSHPPLAERIQALRHG